MPANSDSELVLDQCLDRMLAGNEWTSLVTLEGQLREVIDLMEVAELLRLLAARTPQMPEPRREHVLDRLRQWIQQTVRHGGGREEQGMDVRRALGRS